MQGYEDAITSTVGVDWEYALANATKHPDQKVSTAIGVGTDGKPVNMDLWEYSFDEVTKGYGLNSNEVFQNTEYNPNGKNTETIRTAGYQGTETNGKDIIIPQYISIDNGKTYIQLQVYIGHLIIILTLQQCQLYQQLLQICKVYLKVV